MTRKIERIIIHCSDSAWGCKDVIDGWHRERSWKGIGYHYVINNGFQHGTTDGRDELWDGKIEAGRPIEEVGAHAQGHNEDSVGICLIGKADGVFTPRQISELEGLVGWLRGTYNISSANVIGHRDVDTHGKTCPGFDVRQWVLGGAYI